MSRDKRTFRELRIGDVFSSGGYTFVKLADNKDTTVSLCLQPSNCYNLEKGHYCVMGARHVVLVIKEISDFDNSVPPRDPSSFYDSEDD